MPSLQREQELSLLGYQRIVGVDEAGRGPLAGPVVAAAILLSDQFSPADYALLDDSKKLKHATREALFERLTESFIYGVGIVDAQAIDTINIRQATWLAMQNAVADLQTKTAAVDYVLIDGLGYGPGPWNYEPIVKGDSKSYSIAAASIIAKVTRDRMMDAYETQFPGYGFGVHKGYGTAVHLKVIQELGPCDIHRKTFAPIKNLLIGKDA
jgi:ribonuclease HII